jgi:hypothetical protein
MVAERPFTAADDPGILQLAQPDAREMLDLSLLTKPGPFSLRSLDFGRFWGIREHGRLVAMAGERMAQPG